MHHSFKFEKNNNGNNSKLCHSLTQIVLMVCYIEFPPVHISSVRSFNVRIFHFEKCSNGEKNPYKPDWQTPVKFNKCCFIWNVIFESFLCILSSYPCPTPLGSSPSFSFSVSVRLSETNQSIFTVMEGFSLIRIDCQ